jgi:hypothetical protein
VRVVENTESGWCREESVSSNCEGMKDCLKNFLCYGLTMKVYGIVSLIFRYIL